ncbi:FFLEELY motif protein [Marinobacter sp. SS21]|uniref:FFLEELY motif protein n=1 Tax=Marinobacter sp. SS21 TaxID=2979460 RepID=UPI002330D234|nr:hypothetical protein [Marinobacter sp. SS21]MDC0663182.1 hypothetical protein [Marinobacter sp. SS21]
MYRDRLVNTPVHSDNARQLQQRLLAYHDFRRRKSDHPLVSQLEPLGQWQAERLKHTHQDLYCHPGYHDGLNFLLTDLYAPAGLTRRDDNIDRIFPKMVKWLPDPVLATFAGLVELNLITQQLDLALAETLARLGHPLSSLTESQYCEAYRHAANPVERQRQIELVSSVGRQLDRYVRNRTLGWLLSMTRGAAEMADLADLHDFLHRGYRAFRAMDDVDTLIDQLVHRERRVLVRILDAHPTPFQLTAEPVQP